MHETWVAILVFVLSVFILAALYVFKYRINIICIILIIIVLLLASSYVTYIIYDKDNCITEFREKLKKFDKTSEVNKNVKILLVTYDDRHEEYQDYSKAINERYCKKFNIDIKDYSDSKKYDKLPPWWRKVFIVQDAINDNPQYDYVLWMDKDAAFSVQTDIRKLIDDSFFIISRDPWLFILRPWAQEYYINAGVFMVKNDENGKNLLDEWITGYKESEWCHKSQNKCDLHFYAGSGWRTTSKWAGDTYEQGYLRKVLTKRQGKGIKIYPSHVLTNFSNDSKDYVLVTHLLGYKNKLRKGIFKEINDTQIKEENMK
jgi:hypothetical protein